MALLFHGEKGGLVWLWSLAASELVVTIVTYL